MLRFRPGQSASRRRSIHSSRRRRAQNLLEMLEPRVLLSSYGFQTIASFDGSNGAGPIGGMVITANGNLYGATSGGGDSSGDGVLYELTAGSNNITPLALFNVNVGTNP